MPTDEIWGADGVRSQDDPNAFLDYVRQKLRISAADKRQDWYPKDPKGRPVPESRLTEYEAALVVARGDTRKVKRIRGHWVAKGR